MHCSQRFAAIRSWEAKLSASNELDKAGEDKSLTNITTEKGLGNATFLKTGKVTDSPGTLARVWTINEDPNGNIWVGTIDAGVWRYDRQTLTN